jgi:hypothetical protein
MAHEMENERASAGFGAVDKANVQDSLLHALHYHADECSGSRLVVYPAEKAVAHFTGP